MEPSRPASPAKVVRKNENDEKEEIESKSEENQVIYGSFINIPLFDNHNIRYTIDEQNKPWFVAKDVCDTLGYKNSRDALSKHCKMGGVAFRDTPTESGIQKMQVISEGNLYRLICRCKLKNEQVERFEKMIYEEILPSIRKYGVYVSDKAISRIQQNPALIQQMINDVENHKNVIRHQEEEISNREDRIAELQSSIDKLIDFNTTEAADLAVLVKQRHTLNTFMRSSVCYLIYLGFYDGYHWFKYGRSDRILDNAKVDRMYEHYTAFGLNIKLIRVSRVSCSLNVENKFGRYLEKKNLLRKYIDLTNTPRRECFITTADTPIIEVLGVFDRMVADSFSISEAESANAILQNTVKTVKTENEKLKDEVARLNALVIQKTSEQSMAESSLKIYKIILEHNNLMPSHSPSQSNTVSTQTDDTTTLQTHMLGRVEIGIQTRYDDIDEYCESDDDNEDDDMDDDDDDYSESDMDDEIATENTPSAKECITCCVCKPIADFPYRKDSKKYRSHCRSCFSVIYKKPLSNSEMAKKNEESLKLRKIGKKKCWRCLKIKDFKDFYKIGTKGRCIECVKEIERQKRAAQPKTGRALLMKENQELMENGQRRCRNCNTVKNKSDFSKGSICKKCAAIRSKLKYDAKKASSSSSSSSSSSADSTQDA